MVDGKESGAASYGAPTSPLRLGLAYRAGTPFAFAKAAYRIQGTGRLWHSSSASPPNHRTQELANECNCAIAMSRQQKNKLEIRGERTCVLAAPFCLPVEGLHPAVAYDPYDPRYYVVEGLK